MNLDHSILSIITFVPLLGAVVLALLPDKGRTMQWGALAVALLTFVCTLHLPAHYDYAAHGFQFETNAAWIASPAIRYHLGVDGLSLWLIVLTGFLAPLGVLISWNAIPSRKKTFYVLFLLQQTAMFGVFVALDLFLYYAFWELTLVPMTILIATFGRTENRRKAAIKYFLYAFIPSAILLVAVVWLYARTGTFDVPTLTHLAATHGISGNSSALWLASLAFLFAFAVKVPVFPLHGWLSDAVAEAPTAAVMVLVGKLGLYSILRFSFGIFPQQSFRIAPLLIALAAIGIVYGALIALVQKDLKRLAAFGTLGHVSVAVLGIFTFTIAGLDGGIYQTLNEGLGGAAFFMLLGLLYERYQTYDIREYGGLAAKFPWLVTMFVITTLSVIGLPMLNGFVGEFLVFSGSMQSSIAHAIPVFQAESVGWLPSFLHKIATYGWTMLATSGVILTAAYMLWMIQRVFYGDLGIKSETVTGWDLDAREHIALWPLVALFLAMGVASPLWTKAIDTFGKANSFTPFEVILTPAEAEAAKQAHAHGRGFVVVRGYDRDGAPLALNQTGGTK
jgi:NADH-quinone oxidoreductase subunit M